MSAQGCSSTPGKAVRELGLPQRPVESRSRARSRGSAQRATSVDEPAARRHPDRDARRSARRSGRRPFGADVLVGRDGRGAGPTRPARAARLVERHRPRLVVGAGVAGALSADLGVGDIFVARRVLDAGGAAPPPDPELTARALAMPGTRVRDPGLRRAPARHGLEKASWAARRRGPPPWTWSRPPGRGRPPRTAFPTSSCGRSATTPSTSFPDIFPGAWTRTAASGGGRWRCTPGRALDDPGPAPHAAPRPRLRRAPRRVRRAFLARVA